MGNIPLLKITTFFSRVSSFPSLALDSIEDRVEVDFSFLGDKAFKEPDPDVGKRLENWNASSSQNPEELGEYAQGDIILPKDFSRNGLVSNTFRWQAGVIPYEIVGMFLPSQLSTIQAAMNLYHTYTCVSFKQKSSTDKNYISISNSATGCWSNVGRKGGKQVVNLQTPACTNKVGTIVHELMHAAGFLHEQSRPERDDHITIAWDNIKKGYEDNFAKSEATEVQAFGVQYDYKSVMHYSNKAFSKNEQPTIIPKVEATIGQRDGFSKGDIDKINAMYGCPEKSSLWTDDKIYLGDKPDNPLNSLLSFLIPK